MTIIKRYKHRRLYDTSRNKYVTFKDLANMARAFKDFKVFDNETKKNITREILVEVAFREFKNDAKFQSGVLSYLFFEEVA